MKGVIGTIANIIALSLLTSLSSALKCRRNSPVGYHPFSSSQVEFLWGNGTQTNLSRLQAAAHSPGETNTSHPLPDVMTVKIHHPRISFSMKRTQLPMSTNYKMVVFNDTGHRNVPSFLHHSCLYSTENGSAHGVSAILNLCSERLLIDVLIGRRSYAVLPPSNTAGQPNESFCIYVQYHNRDTSTPEDDLGNNTRDDEDDPLETGLDVDSLGRAVLQQNNQGWMNSSERRTKRSADDTIDETLFRNNHYVVELVIITDKYFLDDRRGGLLDAEVRVSTVVAKANEALKEVNIFLALVGLVIWDGGNQLEYAYQRYIYERILVLFNLGQYKISVIDDMFHLDTLHLITGARLRDDLLGRGFTHGMCGRYSGVSYSADRLGNSYEASAYALTHMMALQIGVPHDESTCECSAGPGKCIMSDFQKMGTINTVWSNCSLATLRDIFERNDYSVCLHNSPMFNRSATCGNYFVEGDEECDCGPVEKCTNPCCIAADCRRKPEMPCAHGACCNVETCQLLEQGTACRTPADNQCDLLEVCNGRGSECPDDIQAADGTLCSYGEEAAFCFRGSCASVQAKCHYLYGPDARVAPQMCSSLNTEGQPYGSCQLIHNNRTSYQSQPCSEEDMECGQIHCLTNDYLTTPPAVTKFTNYVKDQGIQNYLNEGITYACSYVFFTLNYGLEFVPEGTRCGTNKHCRDRRCVEIVAESLAGVPAPSPAVRLCPRGRRINSSGQCVPARTNQNSNRTNRNQSVRSANAWTIAAILALLTTKRVLF